MRAVTEQPVAVMSFSVAVPPRHLNTLVPSVTCTTGSCCTVVTSRPGIPSPGSCSRSRLELRQLVTAASGLFARVCFCAYHLPHALAWVAQHACKHQSSLCYVLEALGPVQA